MSFEIKVEQRYFIQFCVELGKTSIETKKILEMTQSGSDVSWVLDFGWHRRFTDDPLSPYSAKMVVEVQNASRNHWCQKCSML